MAFVALAVERRALSRDELADIIWDDDPPRNGGALNASISKLRGLLTSIGLDGKSSLVAEGGAHGSCSPTSGSIWRRGTGYSIGQKGRTATTTSPPPSGRRPSPPAFSGDRSCRAWTRAGSTTPTAAARTLVPRFVTLARAWLGRGDAQLAATVAESAIAVDPYRELAHRLLVEAELKRGDHAAAQRHLDRCCRILHDELGVGLSAETLALAERLERQTATGEPGPSGMPRNHQATNSRIQAIAMNSTYGSISAMMVPMPALRL